MTGDSGATSTRGTRRSWLPRLKEGLESSHLFLWVAGIVRRERIKLAKLLDPGPEPDLEWEFFLTEPLRCARELRERLPITEDMYLHVAGQAIGDARAYVLYTALDEVMKCSLWLMRMREFLQGEPADPRAGVVERLLHAHLEEEQHAHARRLLEVLITLVSFSTTNEEQYYRHLLALEVLDDRVSGLEDLKEFWDAPSANIDHAIEVQRHLVGDLEKRMDLKRCWYLRERKPIGVAASLRAGRILSSTRSRLKDALPLMSNNEKMVTGFSYAAAYGRTSESVHYSVQQVNWQMSVEDDLSGRSHLAFLSIAILGRVDRLLGQTNISAVERLLRVFGQTESNPLFDRATRQSRIAVGDFVLAHGALGEVLEDRTSRYGNRSFRVRFLAERPIPTISEDWFPAIHIHLFYTRAQFFEAVRSMAASGRLPPEIGTQMAELEHSDLQSILGKSLSKIWQLGLRTWVHEDMRRRAEAERQTRKRPRG